MGVSLHGEEQSGGSAVIVCVCVSWGRGRRGKIEIKRVNPRVLAGKKRSREKLLEQEKYSSSTLVKLQNKQSN